MVLIVEDDVGDVLALLERVGDAEHPAVEKRRVTEEHDLLVGDERIDARARAAAQTHAAVVVHQVFGRLEHQHRVAARVAVEHKVHRPAVVVLLHVARVHELFLHLDQHAGAVAMRATGTKRRRARRDANIKRLGLVDQLDRALDAFGIDRQIRIVEKSCRAARGAR